MSRRDIGKSRCYRAEGMAFGGPWFDAKCKSPLLTEQEARELHEKVALFLHAKLKINIHEALPGFETTNAGHSFFQWTTCYYRLKGLRACVVLHEVAHWAATWSRSEPEPSHGPRWQRVYALAIAEFVDQQTADLFLRLCQELPVMRVAAGPKRRWTLQEQDRDTKQWHNSNRPRKLIPNHQKLAMWRGDCAPVEFPGERFCVWMRMVRDV